jgi:hypothetical protein
MSGFAIFKEKVSESSEGEAPLRRCWAWRLLSCCRLALAGAGCCDGASGWLLELSAGECQARPDDDLREILGSSVATSTMSACTVTAVKDQLLSQRHACLP